MSVIAILLIQLRCKLCNRKLADVEPTDKRIEIKCPRCKMVSVWGGYRA